jgi:hypothetical protein
MHFSPVRSLTVFAFSSVVFGDALSFPEILNPRSADPVDAVARSTSEAFQFKRDSRIQSEKRDATNGQKCGPSAGGASCPSGWCCGPDVSSPSENLNYAHSFRETVAKEYSTAQRPTVNFLMGQPAMPTRAQSQLRTFQRSLGRSLER